MPKSTQNVVVTLSAISHGKLLNQNAKKMRDSVLVSCVNENKADEKGERANKGLRSCQD